MPTYTVYFNPDWPNSAEHVLLGEPFTDKDSAIDALRNAVQNSYGRTTRSNDGGTSWGSNLFGSVNMGDHGDHNHGYVDTNYTDVEYATVQIEAYTKAIERYEAEVRTAKAERDNWQAILDAANIAR